MNWTSTACFLPHRPSDVLLLPSSHPHIPTVVDPSRVATIDTYTALQSLSHRTMFKILQCFRCAREPIHETCHFLAAPAEIRLAIYARLAPCGFLPYVHYKEYLGLLLSCKQIRNEMEGEALRLAPDILQASQKCDANSIMNLRPLRPLDFGSLMHVTISIPCWALQSSSAGEHLQRHGPTIAAAPEQSHHRAGRSTG
jgi:hypothetical protein